MKKFNKFSVSILTALSLFVAVALPAQACTGLIVGSELTEDGSLIFGRTEDLEINHNKIYKVHEAGEYKKDDKLTDISYAEENGYEFIFPHDSYHYSSISDTTPEYGLFDEAGYNEKGLIADMTVSASANEDIMKVDPYLDGSDEGQPIGITEAVLPTVVLATCDNAMDAVKLVANEVATKGAAEGNGFVVADANELWYVEIYSGHQFVGMKYPKDKFSVFPNDFWINQVELTKGEETDNYIISEDGSYIYSKGIFETAKKAGTFKGDEEKNLIDLRASYADKELADSNRSRVCSGILAVNPDADVDMDTEVYDFLQDSKDKKISVKDAMNFTRNRLENLDKEADDRGRGDLYPIGNRNTMESHIFQIPNGAPVEKPGVMWLTLGSPLVQPYVAYYPGQTEAIDQVKNETNDPDPQNSNYWLAMDSLHMVEANRKDFMEAIQPDIEKLENEFIANTKIDGEEKPNEKNMEDAKKSFELQTELHGKLEEKYEDYLKNNDYTSTFYGRRASADFTGMTLDVPKGTADTYLNLSVIPDENETDGSIEIVDNYGNPVEKLENPVTISIPKEAFKEMPKLATTDEDLEVKEEGDKYVLTTEKTAIQYASGNTAEAQTEGSGSAEIMPESASTEEAPNQDKESNSTKLIIGLVIIAGAVAFMVNKSKKNKN